MSDPAIAIAGAGIGGLTAALALADRGFRVELLEQAERLDAIGAGIQLSPNASRVLIDLGLHDALAARATLLDGIRIYSARNGCELATIALGDAEAQRAGAPYWVIHRADLQEVLRKAVRALPSITLRLGQRCEALRVGADGIALGDGLHADALIGADGVWSAVRQHVCEAAPHFSGLVAWRGMIDAAGLSHGPNLVKLWLAAGVHLVAYPIASGARINLVAILPGKADGNSRDVRMAFADWPAEPRKLIEAAGTLTPYPLYTMPPLPTWSHGPVALLGDAAHAMLPFAAQGAGMAIEDAAVLATCLGNARSLSQTEIATALSRYGSLRRDRTLRVMQAARRAGRIYHLRGAAALARDVAIRALRSERLLRRQQWIYGWKAPQ